MPTHRQVLEEAGFPPPQREERRSSIQSERRQFRTRRQTDRNPVYENVVRWRDTVHMFSADQIGLEVRVWFERAKGGPMFQEHERMLEHCMLNSIDPSGWADQAEPCNDLLELAIEVATQLAKKVEAISAVEVTLRGDGSIYYPVWP